MSEENKKQPKKITEILKTNKKLYYAVVGILVILLMFVLFGSFFTEEKDDVQTDSVTIYVSNLEDRLTKLLASVDGVGKVSVAINVESGMETVLATEVTVKETANGKETVETPIIINGKTVVLKELYPKISGVLIVAEGAGSISVLTKIQQATVSLLDVNINQVEILTMK